MIQRKKVNSSKVNLTISLVFHSVLIALAFFFAAREGMLGRKLKEITVTIAPKEKKPEPPKQQPAEAKTETGESGRAAESRRPGAGEDGYRRRAAAAVVRRAYGRAARG